MTINKTLVLKDNVIETIIKLGDIKDTLSNEDSVDNNSAGILVEGDKKIGKMEFLRVTQ